MTANRILFVSDIHIGVNTTTNWYQRDVHEGMLLAIFDYAIASAPDVAELVILGDLADQWTYRPSVTPPSLGEIAAANPAIFGEDGAIARASRAMPGRVTFMPGNHDMAVSAEALSAIVGAPINAAKGPIYEPPAGMGQVACTHGHIYSLFNAPDFKANAKRGLPLGHFITRLSALDASRKLKEGQTVADLAQSGDPTGTALLGDAAKSFYQTFLTGNESLASLMMTTLLDAVGEKQELEFHMLDGSTCTAADVIRAYNDLYERYGSGDAYPRALYGRDPALMALMDTDARNTIAHFADVLSAKYAAVIMGHTHAPEDDSSTPVLSKDYLYANAGFNCPAKPDMARKENPQRATFIELDIDGDKGLFTASVRGVVVSEGRASVAPDPVSTPRTSRIRKRATSS